MNRSQLIERYFKERRRDDKHFGGYPFVTISREAGAGGHALGEAILERTNAQSYTDLYRGWKLFDKELCELLADEPDLHVSMQALLAEEYHSEVSDFLNQVISKETPQVAVYVRLFEIERTLAAVGKVILVGRGASMVTRGMPTGMRIRLVAPQAVRTKRMANLLGLTQETARKLVERHDHERAHFVQDVFGKDIRDPSLYDRVWDTDETSIDAIADEILNRLKQKHAEIRRA